MHSTNGARYLRPRRTSPAGRYGEVGCYTARLGSLRQCCIYLRISRWEDLRARVRTPNDRVAISRGVPGQLLGDGVGQDRASFLWGL